MTSKGDSLLRSNLRLGDTILRGASYFVTDPVVIIGTPFSTQTADDTGDAYNSGGYSLQVKNGQV